MGWDNVPEEIKKELETLGLSVGGTIGRNEEVHVVLTKWFPQKNNKNLIDLLELQGWTKDEGRVIGGTKQLKYRKDVHERFKQERMSI